MTDPFALEGHFILVTGASSGIGRCVAIRAAQRGAKLILTGRDEARLAETASQLDGRGHRWIPLDLSRRKDLEPAIAEALGGTAPLSGFVHSAGVAPMVLLRDLSPEAAEEMMRVNWLSFMALAKAICRRGHYAPGMSVVAVASISATAGQTGLSAYCATKGALIAAVRSLAAEYAPRGIRFNCVSPAPWTPPCSAPPANGWATPGIKRRCWTGQSSARWPLRTWRTPSSSSCPTPAAASRAST